MSFNCFVFILIRFNLNYDANITKTINTTKKKIKKMTVRREKPEFVTTNSNNHQKKPNIVVKVKWSYTFVYFDLWYNIPTVL